MSIHFIKSTGYLMILFSLLIGASWTGLIVSFDYPDVLRYEPGIVLRKYAEGGSLLKVYWSGMALSGFVLITVSTMLHRIFHTFGQSYLIIGTVFGITSGVFNILGFIRWLFSTKMMSDLYLDPASSPTTKEAVSVIFQVMNSYFGVSVGETLGYLTISIWIIILCIALLKSKFIHPIIPLLGILFGLGTFAGIFEWVGFKAAADINAYALQGWLLVMIIIGWTLIRIPASKQIGSFECMCDQGKNKENNL